VSMNKSLKLTLKLLAVGLFLAITSALYLRSAGEVPDFLKGVWAGVWIGLMLLLLKKQRSRSGS
jgi:hypothetical protein